MLVRRVAMLWGRAQRGLVAAGADRAAMNRSVATQTVVSIDTGLTKSPAWCCLRLDPDDGKLADKIPFKSPVFDELLVLCTNFLLAEEAISGVPARQRLTEALRLLGGAHSALSTREDDGESRRGDSEDSTSQSSRSDGDGGVRRAVVLGGNAGMAVGGVHGDIRHVLAAYQASRLLGGGPLAGKLRSRPATAQETHRPHLDKSGSGLDTASVPVAPTHLTRRRPTTATALLSRERGAIAAAPGTQEAPKAADADDIKQLAVVGPRAAARPKSAAATFAGRARGLVTAAASIASADTTAGAPPHARRPVPKGMWRPRTAQGGESHRNTATILRSLCQGGSPPLVAGDGPIARGDGDGEELHILPGVTPVALPPQPPRVPLRPMSARKAA